MAKLSRTDLVTSLDAVPTPPPGPPVLDLSKAPPVESAIEKKTFPFAPPHKVRINRAGAPSPTEHPYLAPYLRRGWGGGRELARKLKTDSSNVCLWARGKRLIPVVYCFHIEELTGGLLTCEMLRPDLVWITYKYSKKILSTPKFGTLPGLYPAQKRREGTRLANLCDGKKPGRPKKVRV